jgi:hypothetical protein
MLIAMIGRATLVVGVIILAIQAYGAEAVPKQCRELSIEEVYDQLIPVADETEGGIVELVVIRVTPSDTTLDTEAKVVIRVALNGVMDVRLWRPRTVSIQQQFRSLRAHEPRRCDDELIAAINVDGVSVPTDRALSGIYRELSRLRAPVAPDPTFYLDASSIEIMIKGAMSQSSFVRFVHPRIRSKDPLANWAIKIVQATRGAR